MNSNEKAVELLYRTFVGMIYTDIELYTKQEIAVAVARICADLDIHVRDPQNIVKNLVNRGIIELAEEVNGCEWYRHKLKKTLSFSYKVFFEDHDYQRSNAYLKPFIVERHRRQYTIVDGLFISMLGHRMNNYLLRHNKQKGKDTYRAEPSVYHQFTGWVKKVEYKTRTLTLKTQAFLHQKMVDVNFPEYSDEADTVLSSDIDIFIPKEYSPLLDYPYDSDIPVILHARGMVQNAVNLNSTDDTPGPFDRTA